MSFSTTFYHGKRPEYSVAGVLIWDGDGDGHGIREALDSKWAPFGVCEREGERERGREGVCVKLVFDGGQFTR